MSGPSFRFLLGLALWALALFGSLMLAQAPDWGHSICGVWGCGPPTQVLTALHMAWFIFLTPIVAVVRATTNLTSLQKRNIAFAMIGGGISAVAVVVAYQYLVWLPAALEWQRPYFWHRSWFALITATDFPIIQAIALGIALLLPRGRSRQHKPLPAALSPRQAQLGEGKTIDQLHELPC